MCKYHLTCLPHRAKKRKLPKSVRTFADARNHFAAIPGRGLATDTANCESKELQPSDEMETQTDVGARACLFSFGETMD